MMADTRAPLVDAHFHTWRRDHPLTDEAWHAPPTEAPVEEIVEILDRHGVIFGVVAAASIFGEYNDYVRHAVRKHRRLRATAVLSPRTDIHKLEQMKADGFVGARLMWVFSEKVPEIDGGDYRLFLRRLADLDWHVHLVDKPERLENAIKAVERSGTRLVIDHMGDLQVPDGINNPAFKAILAAIDRGNTWVKVSCRFRFKPPHAADAFAEQLLRVGGGDRILWGSDWPFAAFEHEMTYQKALADYYRLVPDAEMRRRIDETALRFYFT